MLSEWIHELINKWIPFRIYLFCSKNSSTLGNAKFGTPKFLLFFFLRSQAQKFYPLFFSLINSFGILETVLDYILALRDTTKSFIIQRWTFLDLLGRVTNIACYRIEGSCGGWGKLLKMEIAQILMRLLVHVQGSVPQGGWCALTGVLIWCIKCQTSIAGCAYLSCCTACLCLFSPLNNLTHFIL